MRESMPLKKLPPRSSLHAVAEGAGLLQSGAGCDTRAWLEATSCVPAAAVIVRMRRHHAGSTSSGRCWQQQKHWQTQPRQQPQTAGQVHRMATTTTSCRRCFPAPRPDLLLATRPDTVTGVCGTATLARWWQPMRTLAASAAALAAAKSSSLSCSLPRQLQWRRQQRGRRSARLPRSWAGWPSAPRLLLMAQEHLQQQQQESSRMLGKQTAATVAASGVTAVARLRGRQEPRPAVLSSPYQGPYRALWSCWGS